MEKVLVPRWCLIGDRGVMRVNRWDPVLAGQGGMRPPALRASAVIIALYEHVAAILSASAELAADEEARKAELGGNAALAERARRAAVQGRCSARKLCLRAQADRLFGDPPRWRALFDGHDTLGAAVLRTLDEAVIGTDRQAV